MSRDLETGGYEYIPGARIRSQSRQFQDQIAALGPSNGQSTSIPLTGDRRVVTMSDARARKNAAGSGITLDRARFLTEKIYRIDYLNPYDGKHKSVLLHTKEQPGRPVGGLRLGNDLDDFASFGQQGRIA